jgi:hypothetical protein
MRNDVFGPISPINSSPHTSPVNNNSFHHNRPQHPVQQSPLRSQQAVGPLLPTPDPTQAATHGLTARQFAQRRRQDTLRMNQGEVPRYPELFSAEELARLRAQEEPPEQHSPSRRTARRPATVQPLRPDIAALPAIPCSHAARQPYHEPVQIHDLGRADHQCRNCKALHWAAESVRSTQGPGQGYGICCNHGTVKLPEYPDPPHALRDLIDGTDARSLSFRTEIRRYNAALAFTSLGVDIDQHINQGSGPYIFRIHGALHHRIGSILPQEGKERSYAQLYIHDTHDAGVQALDVRMRRNPELSRDVMQLLQELLIEQNHYSHLYQHAYEILQGHNIQNDIELRISATIQPDHRRYNCATADEIAVILPGNETSPEGRDSRDIILRKRDGHPLRIHESHPAYCPLHYVLLFPQGTPGWSWDMKMHDPERPDRKLTQLRFYAYQLFPRTGVFSLVLHSGRLTQQYMVDVWACIEQERLRYLTSPATQQKLRVELYKGLADHISNSDHVDLDSLGRRTVLPSSFTAGPRYMGQICQDALAIGRYFKKPDLFITMTANPAWPEITRELRPFETASDRPDLVTRVFQLKKTALLNEIIKTEIFGPVTAHMHTVEFQKRGLPHMHCLFFLKSGHKITSAEDVDAVISAVWPDPKTQPALFEVVKRCMVHGPCGAVNPSAPCMRDGKCSKRFPKPFCESTSIDQEGYPDYRRPNDGRSYQINARNVDNSWIVPHNPFLSVRYNCHINVETCVSFSTIKYLTKYIHKGSDQATIEIFQGDEVKKYIDSRYVSACEACFRIFEFRLHNHFPTVYRLQVSFSPICLRSRY